MQYGAHGGKAFQHVEEGPVGQIIGLLKDKPEIADGLVGMAAENEVDSPLARPVFRQSIFRIRYHPACPRLLRMMSSFRSRAVWTPISLRRWFSAATSMIIATLRPGRTGMRM